jgi:hypothetical protein
VLGTVGIGGDLLPRDVGLNEESEFHVTRGVYQLARPPDKPQRVGRTRRYEAIRSKTLVTGIGTMMRPIGTSRRESLRAT